MNLDGSLNKDKLQRIIMYGIGKYQDIPNTYVYVHIYAWIMDLILGYNFDFR